MRIVDCRVIFLSYEYTDAERWTWSGGVAHGQTACLVQVQTDAGITGLGEINPGPQAPRVTEAAVEALKAFIVGEEPWNISSLWARMYKGSVVWGRRGLAVSVMGGIEMALWDLVGKALERPVYELLGGKVRRSIRAYASGGVNFAKGQLEDELRSYVDQGYTAVKVRIGAPTLDANVRVAERARSAIGDAADLLLDAGQGYVARPWSVPEAIRVARALEPYAPFWLEEPYLTDEPEGYAAIRRESSIPIAGGENGVSRWEFKHLLDAGALDIVQPDASVCGGILECQRVYSMAAERSIPVANHMWGSSVSIAANLHLMMTAPHALIAESPCIPNPLRTALFIEPPVLVDGYIRPAELPGLGVELRDEVLQKYGADARIHTQILSGYDV